MTNRRLALAGVVAALVGVGVWALSSQLRSTSRTRGPSAPAVISDRAPIDGSSPWRAPARSHTESGKADPVGTMRLEGQVIDADQQPVGDATVVISTSPVRLTTTEADGSFVFEGLLARTYAVGAVKDGDRADAVNVRVRDDTEPVILRMYAGITLAITVVDAETGSPIVGASVSTVRMLDQSTHTGPDGVAELHGLGEGSSSVRVEADGYSPRTGHYDFPDDPGGRVERTIELRRGASVAGVVLDPDGRGMPNIRVSGRAANGWRDHVQTETDAHGSWSVPAVGSGTWVFSSPGMEHAPGRSRPIDVDGRTPITGVEIQLAAGAEIAGVVVAATGAPVPHAVVVGDRDGAAPANTSADAHGRFALIGLAPGRYTVVARDGDQASAPTEVELGSQDITNLRVELAEATIHGVVVDIQGEPIAEVTVTAMPDESSQIVFAEDRQTVTDSAGRWTIGPLSGESYDIQADWPGMAEENQYVDRHITHAKPGDHDVRITLPAAATVRGVVVLDGVPVTRYGVTISTGHHIGGFLTPSIITRKDGAFERVGLPAGTYHVAIAGDDFTLTEIADVTVAAGEVKDLGTVEVQAGRTVSGRVLDADGLPVEGATVAIAPFFTPRDGGLGLAEDAIKREMMNVRSARSDVDGTFEIRGVAADWMGRPLRGIADKRQVGRSKAIELPEDGTELVLTLERTGAIAVTIVGGPQGRRLTVDARAMDGSVSAYAMGVSSGVTRLERLVAGTYEVGAEQMMPMVRTPAVIVEVKAGETTSVEVIFPTDGVTVVVTSSNACEAVLLLRGAPGGMDPTAMVGMDTCKVDQPVEFRSIAPGDYNLCTDDLKCTPITVKPSPDRQTFKIP